jgi:hypothetical protein
MIFRYHKITRYYASAPRYRDVIGHANLGHANLGRRQISIANCGKLKTLQNLPTWLGSYHCKRHARLNIDIYKVS